MKKEPLITKELVSEHGINEEEYNRIISILGREPNYTELGIFSVMWSEHCSYKSSRNCLKKLPTTGSRIVQGPGENAGVVDIGNGLAAVFKIESHNHPSFIEPFQGAATGVGGILRDIFTMGARPIALMDSLRFGSQEIPKNRYLFERVVEGIAAYGNCMGVPTVGGEVAIESVYNQNPLVNVFCLGIAPKDRIFLAKAGGVGNPVIYVGSKTGRDGIHGATMASEEFDETSEERRPTVQVGDPFTEKLLLEACLELMKTDYIVGIQDMGAAGLTCSTAEMAGRGEVGIEIDISRVPQREEGMIPYEVMLSESQERMLIVAQKGCEEQVREIFEKWDLACSVIGHITDDGIIRVRNHGDVVAEIPAAPLVDEAPVYDRPRQKPPYLENISQFEPVEVDEKNYNDQLLKLLSLPTIADKQWVYRQYDHMVRGNTAVLPGSDAAVLRIKGTSSALAMTLDGNARYVYLDPYEGGKITVAEAARNLVCAGAKPLAITNCLNFGNPEKPEIMWQFEQAVNGIADACRFFDTPVTGGNVSFYNETMGEAIFPTPVIGMIGIIESEEASQSGVGNNGGNYFSQYFQCEGDRIVLLGEIYEELGGSFYLSVIGKDMQGIPPRCDLERERNLQEFCVTAMRKGLVRSAHDCSEGGLAMALAECCISAPEKKIGARINFQSKVNSVYTLFSESQARIVLSIPEEKLVELEDSARLSSIPCTVIGQVGGERLTINDWIDLPLESIETAWKETISTKK
jgi:phosphoribosylformylglycinamidine synthase